jgi:hypothetical protein
LAADLCVVAHAVIALFFIYKILNGGYEVILFTWIVDIQRSSFKKGNDEKTTFVDPMADEDNIKISIVKDKDDGGE